MASKSPEPFREYDFEGRRVKAHRIQCGGPFWVAPDVATTAQPLDAVKSMPALTRRRAQGRTRPHGTVARERGAVVREKRCERRGDAKLKISDALQFTETLASIKHDRALKLATPCASRSIEPMRLGSLSELLGNALTEPAQSQASDETRLARLYVASDILHNAAACGRGARMMRSLLRPYLAAALHHLGTRLLGQKGSTLELAKTNSIIDKVNALLQVWGRWAQVFPANWTFGLESAFFERRERSTGELRRTKRLMRKRCDGTRASPVYTTAPRPPNSKRRSRGCATTLDIGRSGSRLRSVPRGGARARRPGRLHGGPGAGSTRIGRRGRRRRGVRRRRRFIGGRRRGAGVRAVSGRRASGRPGAGGGAGVRAVPRRCSSCCPSGAGGAAAAAVAAIAARAAAAHVSGTYALGARPAGPASNAAVGLGLGRGSRSRRRSRRPDVSCSFRGLPGRGDYRRRRLSAAVRARAPRGSRRRKQSAAHRRGSGSGWRAAAAQKITAVLSPNTRLHFSHAGAKRSCPFCRA